jgi:hypothetical protein
MSFILLTKFKHFCLYCVNFFSTGSTVSSYKISSVLLWYNKLYPAVCLMNFFSSVFRLFISLCFNVYVAVYIKTLVVQKNARTKVYPKVSGLTARSENCKCTALCHYVQLYRYFVSQSSEFCRHNPLCCLSTSVYFCKPIFRYRLSPENFG